MHLKKATLPLLCALTLFFGIATPLSSFARDRDISASGQCSRLATPDRAQLTMTAEAQDRDLQAAAQRAAQIYDRASKAVKKLELADLELRTTEYSMQEVREWEKNRQVSKGFRARIGLRVSTSSIQKLGDVIAIASREELKDVGGLTTYLSTEKLRKEQFECLQDASQDARSKATKLAEAMGASLGDIISVSEQHSNPPGPIMPMMEAMGAQSMARAKTYSAPPVEAGQQEVSVTVNAVFGIR